ncbi:MAG: helix-turn-helix domain-containing protein [Solirubrobacterales bacterium]
MGRKRGPQAMAVGLRFGENLVEMRGRAGLSQIGTAERAGLNRTEINLLEHGRRVPRLDTIVKLAGAVEVEPCALLMGMAWKLSSCPTDGCDADLARLGVGPEGAKCPKCQAELMATDALRAHEIFNDQGSNLEACSRVMSVAERFISLALLDQLLDQRPSALARMAFVTDGPLALFGEVAPIKRPLLRRL